MPVEQARSFGERIRTRRNARGLTLDQAAARARVSKAAWSTYERGTALPSLAAAERIAVVCGSTLGELLPAELHETEEVNGTK